MPAFQVKPGAVLTPTTPALDTLKAAVQAACDDYDITLTITCGRDSHPPGDPHTLGRAIDIRTQGLTPAFVPALYGHLRGMLGPLFYVQFETPTPLSEDDPCYHLPIGYSPHATGDHLHCQVRQGVMYPPVQNSTPVPAVAGVD